MEKVKNFYWDNGNLVMELASGQVWHFQAAALTSFHIECKSEEIAEIELLDLVAEELEQDWNSRMGLA